MKPAVWRLVVAAVLFLAWIGYLAYLVAFTRNPIILSRPQFLVAEMHVLATRQGDDAFVIDEVLWPADRKAAWQGKKVVISNPKECQTWSDADHWHYALPPDGAKVLMPLYNVENTGANGSAARVAPIPMSPGHNGVGPARVYPDSPAVIREYDGMAKP